MNGDGAPDVVFSGQTKDELPSRGSTEFSGVISADGSVKGNFKIKDGSTLEVSANTDGSGFRNVPEAGTQPRSLAEVAKQALEGPARACSPKNLPCAPKG